MKRNLFAGAALLALSLYAGGAGAAEETHLKEISWPDDGLLGTYDRTALQHGFQIYREVCSACHAMHLLSYRNLAALGYNEAEIKSIAAGVTVTDGPNDQGEMFDRPGLPSDRFKSPYPNEKASRAANGGAYPKDLSLIVKAREGGKDYIHSLLTGYRDQPPEGVTIPTGMYYNEAFPGHAIAMPPPLTPGRVTYTNPDGKTAQPSVDDMAKDVTQFLSWAAEPKLEERHRLGFAVMIFLGVFTGLLYAAKRKVWRDLH